MSSVTRCEWAAGSANAHARLPRRGVGRAVHDDRQLFEMLTLEGAQAGLSWSTILRKREGYRRAFAGFDVATVAGSAREDVERLLADPGIVRNRLKVESAVNNAARVLEAQDELGSFDAYLWGFVDGEPIVNHWRALSELPAETELSSALSQGLEAARFPLRRADRDLRVHAVGRNGQRPHHGLLQARVVSDTMSARLTSWIAARKVATRSSSSAISGPPRHSS